jgi:hypothetical protein
MHPIECVAFILFSCLVLLGFSCGGAYGIPMNHANTDVLLTDEHLLLFDQSFSAFPFGIQRHVSATVYEWKIELLALENSKARLHIKLAFRDSDIRLPCPVHL